MRRATVAIALAAVALAASVPADAAPRSNARYDGATPGGHRNHVVVSRSGALLKRYVLLVAAPCSDGRTRTFGIVRGGVDRGIPIDAQGAFSYRRRPERIRAYRTRGLFRFRVTGAFDAAGESVSGTIATSFASRRFDCASGDVPFTLHLDGTPGAPFSTATVTTGRYRASTRRTDVLLRAFVPGREISWARIRWSARCRSGLYLTGVVRRFSIGIRDDDRFVARWSDRVRLRDGGVARTRHSLTGRFFRDANGRYAFRGVWNARSTVRGGARSSDRCGLRSTFSGAAL